MLLCIRALVFVVHGAGEHCGGYANIAHILTQHGMLVFAHDHSEWHLPNAAHIIQSQICWVATVQQCLGWCIYKIYLHPYLIPGDSTTLFLSFITDVVGIVYWGWHLKKGKNVQKM